VINLRKTSLLHTRNLLAMAAINGEKNQKEKIQMNIEILRNKVKK